MNDAITRAVELLRRANEIAVLTGAGVSAESGVATFRGAGGLWEGHRIEEVATPSAFRRSPEMVWRFYNARRANLRTVQPNPGHFALAALEQRFAGRFTLITQNVDGLHRAAGSERVLELHGNINRVRCSRCGLTEDRGVEPLPDLPACGRCQGLLRPDIVWFGEALSPDIWTAAEQAVQRCDCLLVVGTSAVVYPAAGLIHLARSVIEVNLERTDASHLVDVCLTGPSGELLPQIVAQMDVTT